MPVEILIFTSMKFFKSRTFIALVALTLGYGLGYFSGFDKSQRPLIAIGDHALSPDNFEEDLFGPLQSLSDFYDESLSLGGVVRSEDDDFAYFTLEAEGLDENSLKIDFNGNQLLITGEKKVETNFGQSYSSFSRSLMIEANLDITKADLEYRDKKIIIKIPKVNL